MIPQRPPHFRKLKRLIGAVMFCTVCWMLGLSYFVSLIPDRLVLPEKPVDALVVLTSDPKQLRQSYTMVKAKVAKQIFVPHKGVEVEAAFVKPAKSKQEEPESITAMLAALMPAAGKDASRSLHADRVSKWVKDKQIKSLHLVANNYHIPRYMKEMEKALPEGLAISPAPLFADGFDISTWLIDSRSRMLVVREYHQYIISRVNHIITHIKSIEFHVPKA